MGGLVIETIRPGVQFTPDAADAFRRADAQVLSEFGRLIDVNSTYRDWDLQLSMHNAWNAYIGGWGPHPGHSKALHPDDPLAFHVTGEALDSDDWRNARIVEILAENGFIRNRLYVSGEDHHFEYIRDRDRNYRKPASGGNITEDIMNADQEAKLDQLARDIAWLKSRIGGKDTEVTLSSRLAGVAGIVQWIKERIGGSTKSAPTVTDELRGLRDKGE